MALLALFFSALALRPQVIGLGPLLPRIQEELSTAHAIVGLLGTIPVLCMGIFAPAAPLIAGRLGSRRSIALCLLLIAGFGLARATATGALSLVLWTFGLGVGVGIAGALFPVAVKEGFPDRPAFATGIYATGIQLGAAVSAAVAVPITLTTGSWRIALVVFSAPALVLAVVWFALIRRQARPATPGRLPRLPVRSRIGWLLVAVFCLQSIPYYGLNAWLAAFLVERGFTESAAGSLLATMNGAALVATLLVPLLADRSGSRRTYIATAALFLTLAVLGVLVASPWSWAWVILAGTCLGVLFPMVLTLPLDVGGRPADVGAVAGLMLGAGYSLSAVTPVLLGYVRDTTDSFTVSLWLIFAVAALLTVTALTLSPERLAAGVISGGSEPASGST